MMQSVLAFFAHPSLSLRKSLVTPAYQIGHESTTLTCLTTVPTRTHWSRSCDSVHCPYRSSGMIGYYSSKGVIHGLSHLAVLKIFLDSRCFLTYLNGDVYGFASTLHTVPTYIRGVIAKSADVSVVNTLRKVS